jgi:hypothetical protein
VHAVTLRQLKVVTDHSLEQLACTHAVNAHTQKLYCHIVTLVKTL